MATFCKGTPPANNTMALFYIYTLISSGSYKYSYFSSCEKIAYILPSNFNFPEFRKHYNLFYNYGSSFIVSLYFMIVIPIYCFPSMNGSICTQTLHKLSLTLIPHHRDRVDSRRTQHLQFL